MKKIFLITMLLCSLCNSTFAQSDKSLHIHRGNYCFMGYIDHCSFKTVCKEYSSKNMGFTWDLIYEAPNTTESYVHYNWGYDGYDNGFFLAGCTSLTPEDHLTLDDNFGHKPYRTDHTFTSDFTFYSVSR